MLHRIPGVLLLCTASLAAERLTLDQALALAEQNQPQLRVAAAQVAASAAGVTTARAYPNPDFAVLAGGQQRRMIGAPQGTVQVFNFDQPLELRRVRQTRLEAAEAGRESSEHALAEARLAVEAVVKQTFYTALRRQQEIVLVKENEALVDDLRRRIEAQVRVGEAARIELVRADAELATARILTRAAELRRVSALAALSGAVGAEIGQTVELLGEPSRPARLPVLATLIKEVLARYPALRQAEANTWQADARLRNEIALKSPQPVLRAEFEPQPDIRAYRVGIALPLPLWNRREGPINEATALMRQAQAAAELRKLEITTALSGAYGRYELAGQQLATFEEGVLRQAEAALDAAMAAYRLGERGILEVLDSQRLLRNARLDYLNAQFDRQTALIELEQLYAGKLEGVAP